jgi:hypothetical protein
MLAGLALMLPYIVVSSCVDTLLPALMPRFMEMNASSEIFRFTLGLCKSVFSMMRANDRTYAVSGCENSWWRQRWHSQDKHGAEL